MAFTTMPVPAPASTTTAPAAAPPPTTVQMLHAVKAVQAQYAAKIGAQCYAFTSKGTAIVLQDLAVNTETLAGLDIARGLLEAEIDAAV